MVKPIVTRHAADRFVERVMEMDIKELSPEQHEAISDKIVVMLNKYYPEHHLLKSATFPIKEHDCRIVKEDDKIITIKVFDTGLPPSMDGGILRSSKAKRTPRRQPKEF